MKRGKFELRYKLPEKEVGFSGMVNLLVDETTNLYANNFEVIYSNEELIHLYEPAYKEAIRFAISLFLDKYKTLFANRNIIITITDCTIMPIDTSPMIMVYVVYQALLEAYSITDEFICFNEKEGVFIIQKR